MTLAELIVESEWPAESSGEWVEVAVNKVAWFEEDNTSITLIDGCKVVSDTCTASFNWFLGFIKADAVVDVTVVARE